MELPCGVVAAKPISALCNICRIVDPVVVVLELSQKKF